MTKQKFEHPQIPGLIFAMLLDRKGGGLEVTSEEVFDWIPEKGLLWLHFDCAHPSSREDLETKIQLDTAVIEALMREDTRPRLLEVGDSALLAFRGVNLNPGADPEDMVSIRLWVETDRVVSIRKRKLTSVDDLITRLIQGKGPHNSGEFVAMLADRLVRRMSDTVDQFEDRVLALEEEVLVSVNSHQIRSELSQLRRQTITIRRYLAPQRETFFALVNESFTWLEEKEVLSLRETADRLVRHIEDLDEVRDRAIVTQEELTGKLSEQLNSRLYVLSMITAIFLPLGFLTGLLGVNIGGMPGTESHYAFAIFSSILIILVAVQVWVFRLRHWF